ncbi:hypothetical protein Spb1_27810 [Planctopirus ephydatiae]|uniref:Uncharacterized protein n=1 Tax=Planctopirus ephydatiae TaxID=2528019 RepID=A0A518GQF5_9PLAN|nr:hypothetical protein [Planctopirus ephydatiae]QDV30846.1 hypothetical protein Spb1_27810 [Planctopirus ephydatiae]
MFISLRRGRNPPAIVSRRLVIILVVTICCGLGLRVIQIEFLNWQRRLAMESWRLKYRTVDCSGHAEEFAGVVHTDIDSLDQTLLPRTESGDTVIGYEGGNVIVQGVVDYDPHLGYRLRLNDGTFVRPAGSTNECKRLAGYMGVDRLRLEGCLLRKWYPEWGTREMTLWQRMLIGGRVNMHWHPSGYCYFLKDWNVVPLAEDAGLAGDGD